MAGGALVALAALLPWATLVGPDGTAVTSSVEGIYGLVTLFVGLWIAIVGRTMVRGANSHRAKVTLVTAVLMLIFVVAVTYNITQSGATPGVGTLVAGLGAVVAGGASLRVRGSVKRA
jgi:peptidoglycan/LPS O-acetylase OafA/YrhL